MNNYNNNMETKEIVETNRKLVKQLNTLAVAWDAQQTGTDPNVIWTISGILIVSEKVLVGAARWLSVH